IADVIWQEGHIDEAVKEMEDAFSVLVVEEPDSDLAWVAAQLGKLLYFIGRRDDAMQPIELALNIAEALVLPEVFSQALNTKGLILSGRGDRKSTRLNSSHEWISY